MLAVCRRRDILDFSQFSDDVIQCHIFYTAAVLIKIRWTNLKICCKVWRLLTSLVYSKEVKKIRRTNDMDVIKYKQNT